VTHWWVHLSYSQAALVAGIPIFVGYVVWLVSISNDTPLQRPHHSTKRNSTQAVCDGRR
jgi:hypothetical protein